MLARAGVLLPVLILTLAQVQASGRHDPSFRDCVRDCAGPCGQPNPPQPALWLRLLAWDCAAECQYVCTHKVTEQRVRDGLEIEQYYGKWPFVRIAGLQEPASVIFSIGNLLAHWYGMRRYAAEIDDRYPLKWLWRVYALVNINTWVWSAVFHARDIYLTEKLDYFSAFFTILTSWFISFVRIVHVRPLLQAFLASFLFVFYCGYCWYLLNIHFNYQLNMMLNVCIGLVYMLMWLAWSFVHRRPYSYKLYATLALVVGFVGLELGDFPPIWGVFDAHSLWHGGTIIVATVWYDFLIADAKWELAHAATQDQKQQDDIELEAKEKEL